MQLSVLLFVAGWLIFGASSFEAVEISSRRIPGLLTSVELGSAVIRLKAVPLPEADLGPSRPGFTAEGAIKPEVLLVKFRDWTHAAAVRVRAGDEQIMATALRRRLDVEFAEPDFFQRRQFVPTDGQLTNQWHHQVIGSFAAWDRSLGQSFIRIAIVDSPFQMDHPDLASHVAPGWDVVNNVAITNSPGIVHSTICAGLAAAVINNGIGVAGASNCQILPISIGGTISDMYNAIIWASDHDVRVVNISWSGGGDPMLNVAAGILKNKTRGIVAMAGGNDSSSAVTNNQPDIHCISMTDQFDNVQSAPGAGIDFAAPGYLIFSTTVASGYGSGSGSSYATPLFCGVVAVLMSINPTLGGDQVVDLLKTTAEQHNGFPQGAWNSFYGWGRINFAAAASAATASLPAISGIAVAPAQVSITAGWNPNLNYSLWRTPALGGAWNLVTNSTSLTNGTTITFDDPAPLPGHGIYRVQATVR